jgi:predicted HicB family RNase H-like nuclease
VRRDSVWLPEDSLERLEVVEALVAEAEQGYDEPRAQFVSQPPDEEIEALRRIVFRVPADLRDAAQKRADKEKRSLGELAAEALRERLARPPAVRETSDDS